MSDAAHQTNRSAHEGPHTTAPTPTALAGSSPPAYDVVGKLRGETLNGRCTCAAYCWCECGCDAEWQFDHIERAAGEIERLRFVIAQSKELLANRSTSPDAPAEEVVSALLALLDDQDVPTTPMSPWREVAAAFADACNVDEFGRVHDVHHGDLSHALQRWRMLSGHDHQRGQETPAN